MQLMLLFEDGLVLRIPLNCGLHPAPSCHHKLPLVVPDCDNNKTVSSLRRELITSDRQRRAQRLVLDATKGEFKTFLVFGRLALHFTIEIEPGHTSKARDRWIRSGR